MNKYLKQLGRRSKKKIFWVGLFSMIALTGQVFGIYEVPDGWDMWVNGALLFLASAGVIDDGIE